MPPETPKTKPETPLHLPHLEAVTREVHAAQITWRTLAPDGDHVASSLTTLAAGLIADTHTTDEVATAFDVGLANIVRAVLEHFPQNVFWDFDRLAAELLSRPTQQALLTTADQIVRLQEGFGRHGPISFRYAHDFLFGFDWARWVKRDEADRAEVTPFDDRMLDYLERRMHELVDLIEADDRKYHRLQGDQRWRNPFGFSREPVDEARLFEHLATLHQLPVQAWRTSASAVNWRQPFSELRREAADSLGIADE